VTQQLEEAGTRVEAIGDPSLPAAGLGDVVRGARLFLAVAAGEVSWFLRRAEAIDFSRGTVKRSVLLDVDLPQPTPFLLPIAFRYKAAPGPVSVLDQAKRRVPVLTTEESAEIVFTALVLAAEEEEATPSPAEEDLLLSVVTSGRHLARQAKADLLELRPEWQQGRLRHLIDLAQMGLPVFAILQGEERRMVFELRFPPQDLHALRRARWSAAAGSLFRGGITVGGEVSNWPPAASNHARFEAPSVGEITSLRVGQSDGRTGFTEIGSPGSSADLALFDVAPGENPVVWLRMSLSRRLALAFAVAALALTLAVGLVVIGAASPSADHAATVAILLLPLPLAVRIGGQAISDGGEVAGALLRAPVLLIFGSALFALGGIALGQQSLGIPEEVVGDACEKLSFRVRGPLLETI